MTTVDRLIELERAGWDSLTRGERAFYQERADADAVVVFPTPVGVIDGVQMVAAIDAANPWKRYEIEEPRVVSLGQDAAVLVYRVTAQRAGQPEYRAWVSSGYLRPDSDEWRLIFHQHTPITD